MKRSQKIILMSVAVAMLALGFITYRLLRTQPPAGLTVIDTGAPALYLPGTDNGPVTAGGDADERLGLKQVLASNSAAFWVDESDLTIYTVTSGGAVVATPHNGSSDVIYAGDGRQLVSAQANPAGDMVLLITGSQIEPFISVFNVVTQKRIFLPTTARSALWHPNGKDVLYLRDADSKNTAGIYLLSTARSSATQLMAVSLVGVSLQEYTKQAVLLVEPPTREAPVRSWVFDFAKNTLSSFEPATAGLMMRWAHGYGLLFEPKNGLSLVRQGSRTALGIKNTLPAKCAMGTTSLVCAIPQDAIGKLPDSYLQREVYSVDALYEISLTGEQTRLWDGPSQGIYVDAYHLKKIGSTFYFINRYDNKLYSLGVDNGS